MKEKKIKKQVENSPLLKLPALSIKIHGLILEKKIKDDTAEYKITHSFKKNRLHFFHHIKH